MVSPTTPPSPVTKLRTPGGSPTSSRSATNCHAIPGVSLAGFSTTVFPVTIAADVMPARIASGKFHGGITAPTPSGREKTAPLSPLQLKGGGGRAYRHDHP